MTERTVYKTPVEQATEEVEARLHGLIENAFERHAVGEQISLETFKGVLAGYFEGKSIRDWCETLGIPVPRGDRDR